MLEKITNQLPDKTGQKTLLPPLTNDPSSPYASQEPVTVGDYEQRVKNQLKRRSFFQWNSKKINWGTSVVGMGTFLVTGVIVSIYMANAYVVYTKEQQIKQLLELRAELRERKQILSQRS